MEPTVRPRTTEEIVEHLRALDDEQQQEAQEPGITPALHALRRRSAVTLRAAADEIEFGREPLKRRGS